MSFSLLKMAIFYTKYLTFAKELGYDADFGSTATNVASYIALELVACKEKELDRK